MTAGAVPGYRMRHPSADDLDRVVGLIRRHEIAECGEADTTADDVQAAWNRARFTLVADAWVIEGPGGATTAYGDVWPRQGFTVVVADGYVDPDHTGRGLGAWLLRTMEERGATLAEQARDGERVVLTTTVSHLNEASRRLLEERGYLPERYFWEMRIAMDALPPAFALPEGVSVRTFRDDDEATLHELIMDAFKDNDGHQWTTFEEWRAFMIERESFNPELWFIAEDSGGVVAAALCPDYDERGWVRQFAVRRDHRRRGIGLALLAHVFRAQYARGKREVGLVVDSYNRTGARALYERAGMAVAKQYDMYQKDLRPAESS